MGAGEQEGRLEPTATIGRNHGTCNWTWTWNWNWTGRDWAGRDRKGQTGQDRQGRRRLGKRLQHKANSLQPV